MRSIDATKSKETNYKPALRKLYGSSWKLGDMEARGQVVHEHIPFDNSTLKSRQLVLTTRCQIASGDHFRSSAKQHRNQARNLQAPRIKHLRVHRKILHIARNDGQAVALGGSHNQGVHHWQGLSG